MDPADYKDAIVSFLSLIAALLALVDKWSEKRSRSKKPSDPQD